MLPGQTLWAITSAQENRAERHFEERFRTAGCLSPVGATITGGSLNVVGGTPRQRGRYFGLRDVSSLARMSLYSESLKDRLRAIEIAPPPAPWRLVADIAVGGLVCVGLDSPIHGQEFVIAVSWTGRGVVDAFTGDLVARDRNELPQPWFDELSLQVAGIGPVADRHISVAGLWGGGLRRMTRYHWTVEVLAPDWPEEIVVLQPPGQKITLKDRASGCVVIDKPVTEVLAAGFCESGRVLVEATSSDLRIYARPDE